MAALDVAWSFLGGLVLALYLAWLLRRIRLRRPDLIAVTWLALFVIFGFNNLVEAYFFTALFPSAADLAAAAATSLLMTLGYAVLAGFLFTEESEGHIVAELRGFLGRRSGRSWAWRVAAASAVYFPIYLFFGMLISPFVISYYTDPSVGLRLPSFAVVIPLEFLRGLLYVVALLPFLAAFKGSLRASMLVAASLLYVPGGLVPLIVESSLPASIVPFHMAEILADSAVYGAVLARLLGGGRG